MKSHLDNFRVLIQVIPENGIKAWDPKQMGKL